MDWSNLLRLPTTLLLVLAGLVLLLALVQLLRVRQRLPERRTLAAGAHALACAVCVAVSLLLAGGALTLRGYRVLTDEAPVVDVDARILSPQNWALTLIWPDGTTRHATVLGDAWRVEAIVLKWKLPAMLAGVPPLYRLDRLSGRYDDTRQETTAPRSVVDLAPERGFDIVDLRRRHPAWVPGVDAIYGSGVFLPLVDQGHYSVSLMRTGALVARPDAATEQLLAQRLDR